MTGLAVLRGGEAHLALAAVPPGSVQALAVLAQVHVVRALVHVCGRGQRYCRGTTSGRATLRDSAVRTRAGETVPHEAVLAGTPVGTGRVDAVGVQIAVVVFPGALILIYRSRGKRRAPTSPSGLAPSATRDRALTQTLDAVADPTVPTTTLEAAGNVDAGGVHVAVVSPDLALVHIWTHTKRSHSKMKKCAPVWR